MKRFLLCAALLALLCGCGGALHEEQPPAFTMGAVLKTMDAEHWMEIASGMERAAEERGVRLILQYPSSELAAGEQKSILRDMLATPIDALLFSPCDSGDTAWLAGETRKRNLPLLLVDTGATDAELPYIGSDNRGIGRMAYEFLLEQLGEGTRAGIITGNVRQDSLGNRVSGFRFYCARDKKMELAGVEADCNSYETAYYAARRLIEERKVSGIFCTSGVIGMGAIAAREELGRQDVKLVAVDTQSDVVNALHGGRLDGLITQSGYEIGYQAVADAYARLTGEERPTRRFIENQLFTPETADALEWDGRMQ